VYRREIEDASQPTACPNLNIRGRQIGIAGTFLQEQRSENSGCRAEHHIKRRALPVRRSLGSAGPTF